MLAHLYAYLTIKTGNRAGTNFTLDSSRDTLLGRGTDCHITVPDPMCSRVHAIISYEDDGWVVRDQQSRNGTLVNGQKIDQEATLGDGHTLQIGSYAFDFHLSDEPATADTDDITLTQTIVQDMPIAVQQTNQEVLAALPTPDQVQELVQAREWEELELALELPQERAQAPTPPHALVVEAEPRECFSLEWA